MATIICGVDGSAGAAEAVRVASVLSNGLGLRLVLAHVADGDRRATGPAGVAAMQAQQGAARLLEQVAREHGLDGETDRRAEVGDRATELARIAAEEAARLIVVGSRSHGKRRGKLLSGLAVELSGTALCPVVVVPPPARR